MPFCPDECEMEMEMKRINTAQTRVNNIAVFELFISKSDVDGDAAKTFLGEVLVSER